MDNTLQVDCNYCNRKSNHHIIYNHEERETAKIDIENSQYEELLYRDEYQIIRCGGCNSISFRIFSFSPGTNVILNELTEEINLEENNINEYIYPKRWSGLLIEKKIVGVPRSIRLIYREIIESYNAGLLLMCAAGLRMIVEAICLDKKIIGDDLPGKIYALGSARFVSSELSKALSMHRFIGNRALHHLEVAEKSHLIELIKMIELALETIYTVPLTHNLLKEKLTNRDI